MHAFAPHMECLPPPQLSVWPRLAPTAALGMVLYGGTAVALRLGHRTSIDFDFFTDASINEKIIFTAMDFLEEAEIIQDETETLTFLWTDAAATGLADEDMSVKLSFFGGLGFGRTGMPDMTTDGVLSVASLDDLMASKLKVVQQRASAKDYVDIATMVRAGISLAKGLGCARALYGKAFQPSESLKALVYFKDGDLATLDETIKRILVNAVTQVEDIPEMQRASHCLSLPPEHPHQILN
jgi:Nucleotidyl transferase AbiEii toxin, Type IV TA system